MNKRIKKKIEKRYGYKSWKQYKSFDFFYTIHDHKKRKTLGMCYQQIGYFEENKNRRVYDLSVISEALNKLKGHIVKFASDYTFDRYRLGSSTYTIDNDLLPNSDTMPEDHPITTGHFDTMPPLTLSEAIYSLLSGEIVYPTTDDINTMIKEMTDTCGSNE